MEWADWLERVFRGHDFDLTIISHTEPMDINIYARPDYYFRYAPARVRRAERRAFDQRRTPANGRA